MSLRRWSWLLLLGTSGGVVLQATPSCSEQLITTFASTFVSVAADALVQAALSAMTTGAAT